MRTLTSLFFDVIVIPVIVGLVFLAFVLSHFFFWMVVADLTLFSLWYLDGFGEGEIIKALAMLLLVSFLVYLYDRELDRGYAHKVSRERGNFNSTFMAIAMVLFLGDILSSKSYVMLPALVMLAFSVGKYLFCRHNSIVGWPIQEDD